MIITIAGPSGVGKTTLADGLLKTLSGAQPLESFTTRPRRPSDEGRSEYLFVDDAEFDRMLAAGEFLWHVDVHRARYGTRKASLDRAFAGGTYVTVLILEAVDMLNDYAKAQGQEAAVVNLYMLLEDESELRRRFAERGETEEEIEKRIADSRSWNKSARAAHAVLQFLDASQSREDVLAAALRSINGQSS